MIELLDRYQVYVDDTWLEESFTSSYLGVVHRYCDILFIKDTFTGDEVGFEFHYPEMDENDDDVTHIFQAVDSFLSDLICYRDYEDNPFEWMLDFGMNDPHEANRIWSQLKSQYNDFAEKFPTYLIDPLARTVVDKLGEDSINANVY